MEAFIRIRVKEYPSLDFTGSVKVTRHLLSASGMTEEEIWTCAMKNSEGLYSIMSMAEIFGLEENDEMAMRAVMSETNVDGAAALLFNHVFRDYCLEKGYDSLVILPSNTQELMVIPDFEVPNYDDLAQMVQSINESQVDPTIQLEPAVYRYSLEKDEIEIVASL